MNHNDRIKGLIEYLKNKQILTDLEKDIINTANEISKNPFDRRTAENKVGENNVKYPEIFVSIGKFPTNILQPLSQLSDYDVRNNLQRQLELLCEKELEVTNNG